MTTQIEGRIYFGLLWKVIVSADITIGVDAKEENDMPIGSWLVWRGQKGRSFSGTKVGMIAFEGPGCHEKCSPHSKLSATTRKTREECITDMTSE